MVLQAEQQHLSDLNNRSTFLAGLMDNMEVVQGDIAITKAYLKHKIRTHNLLAEAKALQRRKEQTSILIADVVAWEGLEKRIQRSKKYLELEPAAKRIQSIVENVSIMLSKLSQFRNVANHIKDTKDAILTKTEALDDIHSKIHKYSSHQYW